MGSVVAPLISPPANACRADVSRTFSTAAFDECAAQLFCHAEVEGARAALDPLAPELESLLRMARTPHRDGFGGVDKYLIRKLCVAPPPSAAAALGRLSLAQGIKCDVRAALAPALAACL